MATVTNNAAKLTPSAVRVATSFNYVSSTDLIGSGDTSAGIHKRDVDEQMIKRYGDQGITGLLELLGDKKETTNHTFEHYEEDFIHNNFTGDIAAGSGNQGELSISTDDDDPSGRTSVRVGDLIQNANGNIYLVQSRVSDDVSWKVQLVGTDETATVASSEFVIIGNAYAEGTGQPDGLTPRVHHYSNNCQIIKETFEVTGTEATNITYLKVDSPKSGSGYLWYLKGESDTYKRFMDYCELACVLGQSSIASTVDTGDTGGSRVYTTEGLLPFIENKGQSMDLGSSAITMADFDAAVKSLDIFIICKSTIRWY